MPRNGTRTYGTSSTFASLASTHNYACDAFVLVSFVSVVSEASTFIDETKPIGYVRKKISSLGGSVD